MGVTCWFCTSRQATVFVVSFHIRLSGDYYSPCCDECCDEWRRVRSVPYGDGFPMWMIQEVHEQ